MVFSVPEKALLLGVAWWSLSSFACFFQGIPVFVFTFSLVSQGFGGLTWQEKSLLFPVVLLAFLTEKARKRRSGFWKHYGCHSCLLVAACALLESLFLPINCFYLLLTANNSPCPTYQLWPFSSAQENHPKMPVWDPQNEFPGVPWIGLFLGISLLFNRKSWISRNFPAFPWRGFLGSPIAFSGGDGVDMLGSGDN